MGIDLSRRLGLVGIDLSRRLALASIDLSRMPFSRFGSYFCFSWSPTRGQPQRSCFPAGLYLSKVHTGFQQEILRVELHPHGPHTLDSVNASPAILRLSEDSGEVDICFSSADTVRMRGRGCQLRLIPTAESVSSVSRTAEGQLRIRHGTSFITLVVTALRGAVGVTGEDSLSTRYWQGVEVLADPDDSGTFEIALELYAFAERRSDFEGDFDDCAASVQSEFNQFLEATPPVPAEYEELRLQAAYLNWSSVVRPCGLVVRPAMYMSKHWMNKVWSWDHCFNAIALSYGNPSLAWDQLMVMFDLQDETGAIPDSITENEQIWTYCKPPIHGWALGKMMDRPGAVDEIRKQEIYGPLCRWTDWWFDYRDSDRDGVPEYHHGNDSGWDNGTVFQRMCAIESPDLSAHLVIQMEVLSQLAYDLGREKEAETWKQRAQDLQERMIDHFWRGDEFRAVYSGSHEEIRCDSLLPYVSLVLGTRLPPSIARALVSGLRDRGFVTEHGLATELPQSPYYVSDGYWRGPIWAPSTMLIVDGLHSLREDDLVRDIVVKFVRMVREEGFAENFDAVTGMGLRDPAYTWTSSVFLMLAHEHLT